MMIIGIGPNKSPIEALLAAIKQAGGTCGDPNCESCREANTGPVIGTADGSKAQAQSTEGVATAGSPDSAYDLKAQVQAATDQVSATIAGARVDIRESKEQAFAYMVAGLAVKQANANREARKRVYGDVANYVRQQLRGLQLQQVDIEHDQAKSADSPELLAARIEELRNLRALLESKATA